MSSIQTEELHDLTPADDRSRSLPAWIYDNAEFFALEKERIFATSWHFVCHVNDIPNAGDWRTLDIIGEPVFVMRDGAGRVQGFHNVCRHRAARLLDGDAGHCKDRIICPYHAWGYANDGALAWVPFEEEYEELDRQAHSLVKIDTEILLGFVFIRLSAGGAGLAETFEPLRDELALYRTEAMHALCEPAERSVAANWKNGTDNYVDALHVRVAHPGLNSLLNRTYTLESVGGGVQRLHGRVETIVGASEAARRYHEVLPEVTHLPESHRRTWLYYMVWPNFAFNLYPDQVETMQFLPASPTRTRIRCAIYALPDPSPEMAEAQRLNIAINRDVGNEDQDLITRVQHGMGSRSFANGPLGRNEICLRSFAARLREELPVSRLASAPPAGEVAARNRALGT